MYINGNPTFCPECPSELVPAARSVGLPFVQREVGAGDLIASLTHAAGLVPCAPCEARRRWLNQFLAFRPMNGGHY